MDGTSCRGAKVDKQVIDEVFALADAVLASQYLPLLAYALRDQTTEFSAKQACKLAGIPYRRSRYPAIEQALKACGCQKIRTVWSVPKPDTPGFMLFLEAITEYLQIYP
jgi:hypothetical protein